MTDKKNDRKVKEVLQDQELDKVIGGMVMLVSYSFEHKLPPRGGFFCLRITVCRGVTC